MIGDHDQITLSLILEQVVPTQPLKNEHFGRLAVPIEKRAIFGD